MTISNFLEDTFLNLAFNATAYAGQTTAYVKLHIGDPGEDGTLNAATEADRQACTFGTASGGLISNDVQLEWVSVAATETYTYFSLWDASTAGNCLWTGTITANGVTAGDTFQIAVGDLDITLD